MVIRNISASFSELFPNYVPRPPLSRKVGGSWPPAPMGAPPLTVWLQTQSPLTLQKVILTLTLTSSSAVAKRPRDASCLYSFNTKRRAQSIISCFGFRVQIYQCIQLNSFLFSSLLRIGLCCRQCFIQAHLGGGFPPNFEFPPPPQELEARSVTICECNTCKLTECSKLTK